MTKVIAPSLLARMAARCGGGTGGDGEAGSTSLFARASGGAAVGVGGDGAAGSGDGSLDGTSASRASTGGGGGGGGAGWIRTWGL